MNQFFENIGNMLAGFGQSVSGFYSRNRAMVLGGITLLSIVLIVWARLGFTFELSRFYAAPVATDTPGVTLTATPGCTQTVTVGGGECPPFGTAVCHANCSPDAVLYLLRTGHFDMDPVSRKLYNVGSGDPQNMSTWQWYTAPGTGEWCTLADVWMPAHKTGPPAQRPPIPASVRCADGGSGGLDYSQYPQCGPPYTTTIPVACPTTSVSTVPTTTATTTVTATVSAAPSATPSVTINAIADPLASVLGAVSGTASDDKGVAQVKLVLRQGPPGVFNSATNPDWNGTNFIDNGGTRFDLNAIGTTTWSYAQTPPANKMIAGKVYTLYAYAIDTDGQSSGTGVTYRSFTYTPDTPTPTATATISPTGSVVPTQTAPPPSGCYYQEVQCVRAPCEKQLVCPTLTPAQNALAVTVTGRNISTGGAEGAVVNAANNQQVEVIINARNTQAESIINAAIVQAALPAAGITYVPGSTTVNGVATAVDSVTAGGLAIGALGAGQNVAVKFHVKVNGASFPVGQSPTIITGQVSAEGFDARGGQITVVVNRLAAGNVGQVQTGPGDAVLAALLVSAIMTLLYVSYTHTSVFRRREVDAITRTKDPMDFRS